MFEGEKLNNDFFPSTDLLLLKTGESRHFGNDCALFALNKKSKYDR